MTEPNLGEIVEMDTAQIFALTGNEKVKDVISKLRFLSKIQSGEKINVKELFVRDNNDIWQRVLRTMRNFTAENGESKHATLSFIEAVADEAINLIFVYRRNKNDRFKQEIADLIVKNLEDSKKGLRNLTKTYQDDRKFISDVEAIMQTLDARIGSLAKSGYVNGMSDRGFSDLTASLTASLAPTLPAKQEQFGSFHSGTDSQISDNVDVETEDFFS